jgi:hypothetical protein
VDVFVPFGFIISFQYNKIAKSRFTIFVALPGRFLPGRQWIVFGDKMKVDNVNIRAQSVLCRILRLPGGITTET